jgi:hypothetical protein
MQLSSASRRSQPSRKRTVATLACGLIGKRYLYLAIAARDPRTPSPTAFD